MKDKDYIKELFSEKLANHEVPVRSDLWAGIQSQLGNTAATAAAAKGISAAAKWAIGVASAVVVAGSAAWFSSDQGPDQAPVTQQQVARTGIQPQQEQPVQETASSRQEQPGTSASAATVPQAAGKDGTQNVAARTILRKGNEETYSNPPLILKPAAPASETHQDQHAAAGTQPEKHAADISRQSESVPADHISSATGSKEVVGRVEEWVDVFTPNGDGANDYLQLKTRNLKDFSITVMNDRNQVVFRSDNPDFKWDGTVNGEIVPEGNYVYMVVSTDTNGNMINKMVRLTIRR